jgi:hypothetical protein
MDDPKAHSFDMHRASQIGEPGPYTQRTVTLCFLQALDGVWIAA